MFKIGDEVSAIHNGVQCFGVIAYTKKAIQVWYQVKMHSGFSYWYAEQDLKKVA